MHCLVCEKMIPLDRQQAGSPFCSQEHGEQYGAEPIRLRRQVKRSLLPAKFAHTSLAWALLEAHPDRSAFPAPIPLFCDVILGLDHPKPGCTIGLARAWNAGWLPAAEAFLPVLTLPNTNPKGRDASVAWPRGAGDKPAPSIKLSHYRVNADGLFEQAPRPQFHASATGSIPFPLQPAAASFFGALAKPGLRAGQTTFCESFPPADVRSQLAPIAAASIAAVLLLPAPALGDLAAPFVRASLAQVSDLRGATWEPRPLTIEPASFWYVLPIPRDLGKPDVSEFDLDGDESIWSAAGFATEVSPSPLSGVLRTLYDASDFSLQPVWLPALFTLNRPDAAVHLSGPRHLDAIGPAARFNEAPEHADGPGFSGVLLLPETCAPEWEFGEKANPAAACPPAPHDQPAPKDRWQEALRFWRSVPVFARGLTLAIPLIAPAMFFAPAVSVPDQGALAAAIQARATIDLQEDFQAGLGAWTGPKGWESSWSMVSPGSAQPGRLALYRPMVRLTDYRLELQGQIGAKALSWVVRATDVNNYYAAKLVIRKPGPLPSVSLVRYAVIAGRAGPKTERPLPMYLRNDTLYDVLVTVQGDNFTVTVNGQLIETWSESRLKSGGVGLFAEKGEISNVRSVHVTENEDFLGRLCSQVSQWNADRKRIGVKHE
jgi:hypothetical protein